MFPPDNQRRFSHHLQVRSYRIGIVWMQQADLLEKEFLAQIAVPGCNPIMHKFLETIRVLRTFRQRFLQFMDHLFKFRLFWTIWFLLLFHIRQWPVRSKCVFISDGVNQHQCGNSFPAQARCQYLYYTSSNAMSHQHNVCKIELLEQKKQAIGMSPDRSV